MPPDKHLFMNETPLPAVLSPFDLGPSSTQGRVQNTGSSVYKPPQNGPERRLPRSQLGLGSEPCNNPTRVVAKRVARLVLKLSSGAPNRTDGQRKNPIRQPKDVRTGMHYGTSDQPVLQETSQPKQVPGIVS